MTKKLTTRTKVALGTVLTVSALAAGACASGVLNDGPRLASGIIQDGPHGGTYVAQDMPPTPGSPIRR